MKNLHLVCNDLGCHKQGALRILPCTRALVVQWRVLVSHICFVCLGQRQHVALVLQRWWKMMKDHPKHAAQCFGLQVDISNGSLKIPLQGLVMLQPIGFGCVSSGCCHPTDSNQPDGATPPYQQFLRYRRLWIRGLRVTTGHQRSIKSKKTTGWL